MATEQHRPVSQKLPAGLAGVLNPSDDNRDSAYYSSTDASSKHTSAASYNAVNLYPDSNGDKTPSPVTPNVLPLPSIASPLTSSMSVASIVSPTSPTSADPRYVDRHLSIDSGSHGTLMSGDAESIARRESVDSRINHDFSGMKLGPSPYATANHSTTSIQNTLHQQRNPRVSGVDSLSMHRISNGYQPSADRNPLDPNKSIRTAPTITGPTTSNIARAAEPTKGQAWAFPEEEQLQRMPSGVAHSLVDSRRSSVAESFASSQFTTESRLPPGQRRLDDGLATPDYHRMSSNSGEFPAVHHHSLQHRQLGDLQAEEAGDGQGAQPYSRTPELRVSHKLAERKRRTEMKELFENLRDLMPQERGSKASKWEILTKAISEHQRLADAIKYLSQQNQNYQAENEMHRREIAALRLENSQLRGELSASQGSHGVGNVPLPGQFASRDGQRPELPPLRSLSGEVSTGAESMTGVQYSEPPRMGSYRASDGRY